MKRRQFIGRSAVAALAGGIARPSIVRSASTTTLKFVPYADLALLDPAASALVTRNHILMVFETLWALDANGKAQYQMLAGHTVDPDQKTWTLTLRDGLLFHDGTPVRGRDVVASLRRWGVKDAFGLDRAAGNGPGSIAQSRPQSRRGRCRDQRPYRRIAL